MKEDFKLYINPPNPKVAVMHCSANCYNITFPGIAFSHFEKSHCNNNTAPITNL